MKTSKYVQGFEDMHLLDSRFRDIEPSAGDCFQLEMLVREIDNQERTVAAVVSTGDVDRYEEIVEPSAYAKWLPTFMQNNVMLPSHRHDTPDGSPAQIGNWLNIDIGKKEVVGRAWFNESKRGEEWWKLYSHPDPLKRAKAFSVGFIAHEWEMREYAMKSGPAKRIRTFTEVELLEISACSVPANRAALSRAASFLSGRAHDNPASAQDAEAKLKALIDQSLTQRDDALLEKLSDPDGKWARMVLELIQRAQDREGTDYYANRAPTESTPPASSQKDGAAALFS